MRCLALAFQKRKYAYVLNSIGLVSISLATSFAHSQVSKISHHNYIHRSCYS